MDRPTQFVNSPTSLEIHFDSDENHLGTQYSHHLGTLHHAYSTNLHTIHPKKHTTEPLQEATLAPYLVQARDVATRGELKLRVPWVHRCS